jgi:hypothetical protein
MHVQAMTSVMQAFDLRSRFVRPRMKIHGCWAFGVCVNIFVLDETSKHNSSCIIEVIAQTIERAFEILKSQGRSLPRTLLVFVRPPT